MKQRPSGEHVYCKEKQAGVPWLKIAHRCVHCQDSGGKSSGLKPNKLQQIDKELAGWFSTFANSISYVAFVRTLWRFAVFTITATSPVGQFMTWIWTRSPPWRETTFVFKQRESDTSCLFVCVSVCLWPCSATPACDCSHECGLQAVRKVFNVTVHLLMLWRSTAHM